MLLAIDVGNTNTVLGVFEDEKLERSWRIKSDARTTADELALTFRGLLADHESPAPRRAPPSRRAPRAARHARAYYPGHPDRSRRARSPHRGQHPVPTTRRRSAPTASSTPGRPPPRPAVPSIVVDFGTTTNFDVISAQRRLPRRRAGPRYRDLARRPRRPRRAAAQGRACRPARTDRQEHCRGAAVGHPLRLRRPGRRHGAAAVDSPDAGRPRSGAT